MRRQTRIAIKEAARRYRAGHTLQEIAQDMDCAVSTLSSHLQKYGVDIRPPGRLELIRAVARRMKKSDGVKNDG